MTTGDELYERVNGFGFGDWLESLLSRMGHTVPAVPDSRSEIPLPRSWGYVLTFGRVATPMDDPRDEIVLMRAEGDGTAAMPFRLDPVAETLESAIRKLSDNTAGANPAGTKGGDRRVSFFLDGGRVVELRFNDDWRGFDKILMVGLGAPRAWTAQMERLR